MRWEGHVSSMGEMRNAYNTLVAGRDQFEDIGIDGKIILDGT
jgi:hypothetical protein